MHSPARTVDVAVHGGAPQPRADLRSAAATSGGPNNWLGPLTSTGVQHVHDFAPVLAIARIYTGGLPPDTRSCTQHQMSGGFLCY